MNVRAEAHDAHVPRVETRRGIQRVDLKSAHTETKTKAELCVIGSYGRDDAIVSNSRASNVQAIIDELYIVSSTASSVGPNQGPDVMVRARHQKRTHAPIASNLATGGQYFGFDRPEPDRLRVPAVADRR